MSIDRDIRTYPSRDQRQLLVLLSQVVYDLAECYDHAGFLRSEELRIKKEQWSSTPDASIQTRDRAATYAASEVTSELLIIEAQISHLSHERSLIERLIDAV